MTETFAEKIARLRAEKAAAKPKPTPLPTNQSAFDPSDAPEIEYEPTEDDREVDSLLSQIDIVTAYAKWCGKSKIEVRGGQREGIKISCPNPSHPDKNPSAWVNLDKHTWFCGGCQEGGDIYDIAAWHFGYSVPGYKDGANFPKLRRDMAKDLGFVEKRSIGGTVEYVAPVSDEQGTISAPPVTADPQDPNTIGTVSSLTEAPEIDEYIEPEIIEPALKSLSEEPVEDDPSFDAVEILLPTLDWQSFVPSGTFLDVWMQTTTIDDVPEEFHFWHGLQALGMAVGRNRTLFDTMPVYANLFICVLGKSGSGKSKAKNLLDQLLLRALPWDSTSMMPTGTKIISSPASGEQLVFAFKKETPVDPSLPRGTAPALEPVRGLVDYNELSSLIGRTARLGSVLPSTLMEFYDMKDRVSTQSRTHGEDIAILPFCNAHTTTQIKSIRRLLGQEHADSGFLNRWVFVAGKSKESVAIGAIKADVSAAVPALESIRGWSASPYEIPWAPEAKAEFEAFYKKVIKPRIETDQTDMLTRLDLLMKKLVLLFTVNMKRDVASLSAVQQAEACFQYVLDCYLIPSEQIGNSIYNEIQTDTLVVIDNFFERKGKWPTMRDITRLTTRKKWPIDAFNRTIKSMVELDILREVIIKGDRGPTVKRYHHEI